MRVSVSIGHSQHFQLHKALLVHGESDYNAFPYRHPFLTMHDVVHDPDGSRLGVGKLVTPAMLRELMDGLGQKVPAEILPATVLVRTSDMIVWWRPASPAIMFFSDHNNDASMKKLNGKRYPHPALVFKAQGEHLWIRALAVNERPVKDTKLYMAPYWNCYANGAVCTGSMSVPAKDDLSAMNAWEQSFFNSEFTHAAGNNRHTRYPQGFLAMWASLRGMNEFPSGYLVNVKQALAEFVANDDSRYTNDPN